MLTPSETTSYERNSNTAAGLCAGCARVLDYDEVHAARSARVMRTLKPGRRRHPMVDRESIRELDLRQLESLSEFVSQLVESKKAEKKRTVWRVCVRGMCYGNFREDEYLKAAEFLAAKAKEIDADPINDRRDRQLEIVGQRVPDSEYEEWFNG